MRCETKPPTPSPNIPEVRGLAQSISTTRTPHATSKAMSAPPPPPPPPAFTDADALAARQPGGEHALALAILQAINSLLTPLCSSSSLLHLSAITSSSASCDAWSLSLATTIANLRKPHDLVEEDTGVSRACQETTQMQATVARRLLKFTTLLAEDHSHTQVTRIFLARILQGATLLDFCALYVPQNAKHARKVVNAALAHGGAPARRALKETADAAAVHLTRIAGAIKAGECDEGILAHLSDAGATLRRTAEASADAAAVIGPPLFGPMGRCRDALSGVRNSDKARRRLLRGAVALAFADGDNGKVKSAASSFGHGAAEAEADVYCARRLAAYGGSDTAKDAWCGAGAPAPSEIDPEFLNALPPEMRAEVLAQHRAANPVTAPAPAVVSAAAPGALSSYAATRTKAARSGGTALEAATERDKRAVALAVERQRHEEEEIEQARLAAESALASLYEDEYDDSKDAGADLGWRGGAVDVGDHIKESPKLTQFWIKDGRVYHAQTSGAESIFAASASEASAEATRRHAEVTLAIGGLKAGGNRAAAAAQGAPPTEGGGGRGGGGRGGGGGGRGGGGRGGGRSGRGGGGRGRGRSGKSRSGHG
ncbi:hypothetical protein PPROV_000657000 [Pycnococcus provasolii]|uniref:Uncharacterized protein n=1 Tax=Pycnococcus provasolii TaxID=41880 RepID=A0A830HLR7_9CHLO|nr:hypothetical protein PPROV_000657000 [Pycnococcus provasolii]